MYSRENKHLESLKENKSFERIENLIPKEQADKLKKLVFLLRGKDNEHIQRPNK